MCARIVNSLTHLVLCNVSVIMLGDSSESEISQKICNVYFFGMFPQKNLNFQQHPLIPDKGRFTEMQYEGDGVFSLFVWAAFAKWLNVIMRFSLV